MKIQSFDFSINVLTALLWRHNEAVNLQALLQNKQDALDELNKDFWESWVNDVFNLQTANRFGLSVWSIILNIPLTIESMEPEPDNSNFGFGSFRKNFNNGNFTAFGGTSTLSLEDARTVIKLRYYQLVTRGTIPECNKIVADVFSPIMVYALDGLDMTMTYVFSEYPSSALRSALDSFDLLPRPSAVEIKTVFQPNKFFGFGSFRKNFNNGNFRS
jgi:hypothetical protein